MRCTTFALAVTLLSACTANLPDFDGAISDRARDADYPTLDPLPDLIARADADSTVVVQTQALEARVARLKARARALSGRSVIDGATRIKLLNATKGRPA